MLLNLREYHRPVAETPDRGLSHALELFARREVRTAVLAGGDTLLAAHDTTIEAVVDLQGLGLDFITADANQAGLRIGALTTRAALAGHEAARASYDGILAEAARRWSGSVQRNRATVGGAVAVAAPNDPLLAALLACDARVVLADRAGEQQRSLGEFLARRTALLAAPAIITELWVPWPASHTGAALASVARTLADAPIVIAAAVVQRDGEQCGAARLALGGVAEAPWDASSLAAGLIGRPWTAAAVAALAGRVAETVRPTGDFRGSAEYRQAMAEVLSARALAAAWHRAA